MFDRYWQSQAHYLLYSAPVATCSLVVQWKTMTFGISGTWPLTSACDCARCYGLDCCVADVVMFGRDRQPASDSQILLSSVCCQFVWLSWSVDRQSPVCAVSR